MGQEPQFAESARRVFSGISGPFPRDSATHDLRNLCRISKEIEYANHTSR